MKNCPVCGTDKNGSERFCLNCGNKFQEFTESTQTIVTKSEKRSSVSPKKRKLRIASVVSVAVIIMGLFGGHLFLSAKYDASKTLIEMNQAFSKGDHSKFLSHFSVADDVVKDEEGFYTFFEEESWEEIRNQMRTEASLLEKEGFSNIIKDSNGNKFISVISDPILFGVYNDISYMVHSVKVETKMTMDNTTIVMKNVTVTGNEDENVLVGYFLPGSYSWKASVSSEYSPIESGGFERVSGDGNNHYVFSPSLKAGMISVTSDDSEATLWINGKSTGKTVKEMKSFGPVAFNGSVEVLAETKDAKGTVVKGKPVSIESATAHIEFVHIQEKVTSDRMKQQEAEELRKLVEEYEIIVSDYISSYRFDFEQALNYADFSYIANYFETGSKVQAEYIADIERHGAMKNYYNYDFQSNTVTSINAIDKNTLLVNTSEMFYFTSNEDEFRYIKTKAYTVKIKSGEFFITNIEQKTSENVEL